MTNTGLVVINFSEDRIDEAMLAQIKTLDEEEQLTEDSDNEV